MKTNTHFFNLALATSLAMATTVSCSKDDNGTTNTDPIIEGDYTYVVGVGVTDAENNSSNYIVYTDNLLSGKISLLNNGILQEGYRDFLSVGNFFYSIGGLGVTDVDAYYINDQSRLTAKKGLVFESGKRDLQPIEDGKTLLGTQVLVDSAYNGTAEFSFVDVASNTVKNKITVNAKDVYKASGNDKAHGWRSSGVAVSGGKAYQTIFPFNDTSWVSPDVKAAYVAVYSYPDFKFQKLIQDTRTGPAGAPLYMRSGIFAADNGDVYTISHDGYGFTQTGSLKEPAILRIKSGTDEFDQTYHFKTGDRVLRAIYVGNNKLFAQIQAKKAKPTQWDQTGLRFAIIDLENKNIQEVANSPLYDGAEEMFLEGDKVYVPAKAGSALNVYEVNLTTATAVKGVAVEASYIKAVGKLTK